MGITILNQEDRGNLLNLEAGNSGNPLRKEGLTFRKPKIFFQNYSKVFPLDLLR